MLTWIKQRAVSGFAATAIDDEELHLELVLPVEMQKFLSGKNDAFHKAKPCGNLDRGQLLLDEHELALG
jgi:hypothetical protein